MPMARRSFAETLTVLALRNARAVEWRARVAAALSLAYPTRAEAFRAIESAALRQLFRILAERPETEGDAGHRPGAEPSAGRINIVVTEKE